MSADWKSRVSRSFDSCAGSYALYSGAQERVAWTLSSFLPGLNAPDVLEIGCGTGLLTRYLAAGYPDGNFLVTDIAPHMLRSVSKTMAGSGRRIQWREMDGENPDLDRRFDLIVANMAVQWFEDSSLGLDRLAQCLKPGGRLYYTMPGPRNFPEWKEALRRVAGGDIRAENEPAYESLPGIFRDESFVVHYKDARAFLQMLKKTGAGTPRSGYRGLSAPEMRRALGICDEICRGRVTWHILYGCIEARSYAAAA